MFGSCKKNRRVKSLEENCLFWCVRVFVKTKNAATFNSPRDNNSSCKIASFVFLYAADESVS